MPSRSSRAIADASGGPVTAPHKKDWDYLKPGSGASVEPDEGE